MKVLVCGSRSWDRTVPIYDRLRELPADTVVLSGAARGADKIAAREARELGMMVRLYPANWRRLDGTTNRAAGIERNLQMLDANPELVIAFWDGQSRGTKHTIKEAKRRGIPVEVIK